MSSGWTVILLSLSLVIAVRAPRNSCVVEDKETLKCNFFPKRISEGISRVRVMDFIGPNENMVINSTDFNTEGWGHVKYLEISNSLKYSGLNFTAETFLNLKMLEELQLHLDRFFLDPDTFVGLNFVRSLDVSDCFRLSYDDLLQSLDGTDKIPGLTKLTMSGLSRYHPPNIIDARFGQILQPKNLTYLDISTSEITEVHFSVLEYLSYLNFINLSSATIGDTFQETFNFSHLKGIVLDFSHLILPDRMRPPPGKFVISNMILKNTTLHNILLLAFLDAKIINASSLIPALSSIWVKNITVIMNKTEFYFIQRIIGKHNNLKYLDIHVDSFRNSCIACSLDKIDLSYNGLQFINPSLASVAPKIKTLNLSFNQLFEMSKNNASMFATLFKPLTRLQFVSLSNNNLETIPDNMFGDNLALEIIDLSGNKLSQVTFLMTHLNKLRILDLRHNFIRVLDEMSLNHLDSILENTGRKATQSSVLLTFNPLSCSDCDSKSYIIWLLKTPLVNITSQNLMCNMEDGTQTIIDQRTLDVVRNRCNFVLYNVIISLTVAFISVLTAIALVKACKEWHRGEVIMRLKEGKMQNRYAALLVYHEDDTTFVKDKIVEQLETEMKAITDIRSRNLIIESENVDPGHSLGTELSNVVYEV